MSDEVEEYHHEHADHPNFIGVVRVYYTGEDYREEVEFLNEEYHALIFYDRVYALTMYEYCYALWNARTGKNIFSNLGHKDWKLDRETLPVYADELAAKELGFESSSMRMRGDVVDVGVFVPGSTSGRVVEIPLNKKDDKDAWLEAIKGKEEEIRSMARVP